MMKARAVAMPDKVAYLSKEINSFIENNRYILEQAKYPSESNDQDEKVFLKLENKAKKLFNLVVSINPETFDAKNLLAKCKQIIDGTFDLDAVEPIAGEKSAKMAVSLQMILLQFTQSFFFQILNFINSVDAEKMQMGYLNKLIVLAYFGDLSLKSLKQSGIAGLNKLYCKYTADLTALKANLKTYHDACRKKLNQDRKVAATLPVVPNTFTQQKAAELLTHARIEPSEISMPRYFALRKRILDELELYRKSKSNSVLFKYSEKDEHQRTLEIEDDMNRLLRARLQDSEFVIPKDKVERVPHILLPGRGDDVEFELAMNTLLWIKAKKSINRLDAIRAIQAIGIIVEEDKKKQVLGGQAFANAESEVNEIIALYRASYISAEDRYIDHTLSSLYSHHYAYLVKSNSSSGLTVRLKTILVENGYRPVVTETNRVGSYIGERLATIPKLLGVGVKYFGRLITLLGGIIQPAEPTSDIRPGLVERVADGFRNVIGGAIAAVGNFFQKIGAYFHNLGKDSAADAGRYQVRLVRSGTPSTTAKLSGTIPIVKHAAAIVPEQSGRLIPGSVQPAPSLVAQHQAERRAVPVGGSHAFRV